jgi:hypothetical protein
VTESSTAIIHAHVAAVSKLLLGKAVMKPGVAITAGDPLGESQERNVAGMAHASQTDVIHLEFATNDAGGFGMVGICVFVPRDHVCYTYRDCRLWLGEGKSRALILPIAAARGHFRLAPCELIHIDGKPCGSPDDGVARAHLRRRQIMALAASVERQVKIEKIPAQL